LCLSLAGTFSNTRAAERVVVDYVGGVTASKANHVIALQTSTFIYGMVEYIYLQSEVGSAGSISKVFFYNNVSTLTTFTTLKVYLGTTSKTTFTGTGDWVTTGLNSVYSGSLPLAVGWNTITLGTSFSYDGTNNLAVMIDNDWGKTVWPAASQPGWVYQTTATTNRHMYKTSSGNMTTTAPGAGSRDVQMAAFKIEISGTGPDAPTIGTATGACDAGLTVTWTDNSANEDRFVVYRNATNIGSAAANVTSYTDNPPFTTIGPYTYKVWASNTSGSNASGVCTGTASIKPASPTSPTATGACSQVTVSWTDASNNETGFIVYKNGAALATLAAGTTQYVNTSLTTAGPYTYVVWASNTCGSNSSGVCTGTASVTPTAPSGATATGACNQITVSWTDASSNETAFIIYRNAANIGSVAANATSYANTSLTTAGPYTYVVYASNSCGSNVSGVCTGTASVTPTAPTIGTATGACDAGLTVTWTDGSSNEAGFVIYRNGALLASTAANATNYVDNPPFTTAGPYTYRVYASNTCGSNSSGVCTGTASIKPTAPTGAAATGGCNNVTVTWTDASTNETGFTIYRNGALLGTAVANTGTYVDNAATSGSYTYVVWASNTCGSNSSGVCTGTPTTFPNSPTGAGATGGCNSVTVTWTDASSNETGFVIFRNGSNVGSAASGAQIYTDNALTVAGAYTYRVWASNGCGSNSSGICTGTAAVSASAPTMSAPDGDCGTITISWSDVSNETGYVIYRNGTALVSTIAANATSYVDNVTTAGPYTYRVYASNTCGSNSSGTAQGTASFTPTAPAIGTATGGCGAGLTVTWTDNSSDETRFFIYRNNVNLANTVAGATMYLDNPPFTTAGPYTYRVWASNACGSNSSGVCTGTAQINAIAPTIGTATGACNQITVTWTDNSSDEVRFVIYRSGSNIGSAAANATNYVDASLTTAGPYTYYVYASNTCGSNSSGVCTGTASVSATAPTGAAASSDECTKVTVTWTDASSNEDRFIIYRNGVNVGSAVANTGTYVDNISTGGSYTYQIYASNTCGSNSSGVCTGKVLGKIDITAPNGGESVAASGPYTITWDATGQGGNVSVDYSTNSGTSWTSIIASTSETGSYNWSPVPEVTTTTGRVRVLRTDGPTCTSAYGDTSDADFSIEGVGDQMSGEFGYYTGAIDAAQTDELYQLISLGSGYLGIGRLNSRLGLMKWADNASLTFSKYMSSDATATGYTVCKSSESGTDYYILGGKVTLSGYTRNLIIKLEDDATVVGAYRYGSVSASGAVGIRSIIVDGSYYIATGAYVQAVSNTDVLLMKLNQDLTVSWAKSYELSDATHYDIGYAVAEDAAGYYGITGANGTTAGSDLFVMRVSSDGATVSWQKSVHLNSAVTNVGYSIIAVRESATDYYVVAGYASSSGSAKGKTGASIVVVKLLASDGSISWIKNLSCAADNEPVSIIQASSGCYVVAGNSDEGGTDNDVFLVKLNTDGSETWAAPKAINACSGAGTLANPDMARSVIQDVDNTYVVGGYAQFGNSGYDVLFLKAQTDGDMPDCDNVTTTDNLSTPSYTTPSISSSVGDLGTSITTSYTPTFADYTVTLRDICGSPFSVEFTGMTANPEVGYIQLNWFTETEKDNLKWLLQRSENKEDNYTQISEIPAKGAGPNSYVYPDSTITPGLTYWYKLGAMDNSGNTVWYNPVSASARLEKDFPLSLKLESINPSNRTAKINYTVPSSSAAPYVNITVYNSAGQIVKILVNEKQKPGPYTIYWNGKDARNKTLGSGEYFCRLKTDGKLTYKLIRMR